MRRRLIQAAIILFIGINFLLVYMDDDGKVERKSYLKNWSQVFEADVAEHLHKPGVLASVSEDHVYFDEDLGSFQEFLVEEGAEVSAGDPLYTYQVLDYVEAETDLMNEVDVLNEEIAAIETAISEMELYQIPDDEGDSSPQEPPLPFDFEEEMLEEEMTELPEEEEIENPEEDEAMETAEEPENSVEAELMKEQYIIEKEKELAQRSAELSSVENQLTELQSDGDTITVESPFEGKIKTVQETLEDPLIAIESTAVQAEGELTEVERSQIEPGQAVEMTLTEKETFIEGEIAEVSDLPKAVEIEEESIYPFHVSLHEDEETELEELLPGYHVNLRITLDESLGAAVLFEDLIFSDAVWKMNEEGKLMEQGVETGIAMDDMLEITDGAAIGEFVAEEPAGQFRNGAVFITPLKVQEVAWRNVFHYDNWSRPLVSGFLSR
ncbi:efflux RND transporter periplasmic adaptor subunit [Virgibacillus saliphilus]|uniref:efflux RND transporter periplasmic adaptor subunit n=1 Tax=Virgibacillus saliphilus TaxID=2831674 RepID=UPI002104A755|nr:efflux RND transporter periplasmic adaptor subunit [Virgibacillus sp. NKC19-3]